MAAGVTKRVQNRTGKTIVLTGAGNGIGRATALALGREGHRLGLIDIAGEALDTLSSDLGELGVQTFTSLADVRDSKALEQSVGAIESELGPTDVLITCAGVGRLSTASNLDVEGLQWMFDINVIGMARTIQTVLPGMIERKSGHIIGIASVAGYRGLPWMPGYCATKAAVANYLEALRPGLKRRGVRITTLYPGFVASGMTMETPFRKPMKMLTADQAAAFVVQAVDRQPRDMVFPYSAKLGMGFLKRLPTRVFDRVMDRAGPLALTTDF